MPLWLINISAAFLFGQLVFRLFAVLGLAYVSFYGLSTSLNTLQASMDENLSQLPLSVISLLEMSGIITIIHWVIGAHITMAIFGGLRATLVNSRGASRLKSQLGI